ncbi:FecR family protein [Chitinophaga rhizosphaerae]|uniref:FecR family protein n=1 Tax=Chitinophaga rhizosphaerae TaxID=1864947 RepID=UPI000F7FECDA|nr:FecR domain-containing protein [Chitinophaga rhizosphaerae]
MTQEQLNKYFRGECTEEEAEAADIFLTAEPGRAVAFLEEDDGTTPVAVSAAQSARMWEGISRHVHRPAILRRIVRNVCVAASIAVLLGLGMYYWHGTGRLPAGKDETAPALAYTIIGNTDKEMKAFQLPDGSTGKLAPGSSLRYAEDFGSAGRILELTGTARFQVAKDTARPFTVMAGELAVTALGTIFDVNAPQGANKIYVRLLEGKISVRRHADRHAAPQLLLPGDRLVYDKAARSMTLTHMEKKTGSKGKPAADDVFSAFGEENWYMFNNQALPEVLDQLESLYHVRIDFDRAALRNMSFIGRLDGTDSLQNVLRAIAVLNDLKLSKTTRGYLLKQ